MSGVWRGGPLFDEPGADAASAEVGEQEYKDESANEIVTRKLRFTRRSR